MENNTLTLGNISFSTRLTDYYDENEHMHDFYEIVIVTVGKIMHISNGVKEELTIGKGFLICPYIQHKYIRTNNDCIHRDILISKSLFKETCDFIDPELFSTLNKKSVIPFQLNTTSMLSIENKITTFLETKNLVDRLSFIKVISCDVIGHIFSFVNLEDFNANDFKSKCLTTIHENLLFPNTLELVRNKLGYSHTYFTKKFKNTFQETPTDYINFLKIQNAAYLLISSSFSVSQICEQIGFLSIPYFMKLFKRHFGATPSKYRKNHKNQQP